MIRNNTLNLKTQQRFKSERHNIFTEEINKIALSSNDDKIMQSIGLIETYAYGMGKDLVSENEEIKCKNIIKQTKIINFETEKCVAAAIKSLKPSNKNYELK